MSPRASLETSGPPAEADEKDSPPSGVGADGGTPSGGDSWSFAVEPLIDENLTSITLTGEIDARAQAELDRVLDAAVEAQSKLLLVDASKADFISTAAMLSLVSAAHHLGRVLIYRPNSVTERIFRLIDPAGLCQSIT
jgi:anti-anti-sigma regulatory factor